MDIKYCYHTQACKVHYTIFHHCTHFVFFWLLFRDSPSIGYILACCSGVLTTLEILLIRYYSDHLSDMNIFIALFWTYAFGTIVSGRHGNI